MQTRKAKRQGGLIRKPKSGDRIEAGEVVFTWIGNGQVAIVAPKSVKIRHKRRKNLTERPERRKM